MRIYLFGDLRVTRLAADPGDVKLTHTSQLLLAYLLVHRRHPHVRETLIDLLWADHDTERARSCLNTALWRLRRALEPEGVPAGAYLVTSPEGRVGFNPGGEYWLDVEEFESVSGQALARPVAALGGDDVARLQGALQLYTRDLLEGFYDDWVLRERERLRTVYLKGLAHLMHYYRAQQAFEDSARYAEQILGLDPLREEVHRELMALYVAGRQRTLAVRQYEKCCDILARELGVAPMPETQALYEHIKADAPDVPGETAAPADLPRPARHHLLSATQAMSDAVRQLQRATQHLESLLNQIASG
jgi:DNA-binding SARP family transcriptional activator